MTTQTLSRLIITTAVVASLAVLLFSGPTTSAAKADKSWHRRRQPTSSLLQSRKTQLR